MKKTCSLTLLMIVAAIISCKKSDNQPKKSAFDLLTSHSWQLTSLYTVDVNSAQQADFTAQEYNDCELRDSFLFTKDYVLKRTHNDSNCQIKWIVGPNDGAQWSLDSADTYITIKHDGFFDTYEWNGKILQLNTTNFSFEHFYKNYAGEEAAYIFNFKAQ